MSIEAAENRRRVHQVHDLWIGFISMRKSFSRTSVYFHIRYHSLTSYAERCWCNQHLTFIIIWLNQNTYSICTVSLGLLSFLYDAPIQWFGSSQAVSSACIPCSIWLMNCDVSLIEIIRTIDWTKTKSGVFSWSDCELNCGLSSISNKRKSKIYYTEKK